LQNRFSDEISRIIQLDGSLFISASSAKPPEDGIGIMVAGSQLANRWVWHCKHCEFTPPAFTETPKPISIRFSELHGYTNGQFSGHVAAFRHLKKPHKLLNKRKAREADATPSGKRPTILLNTSQTNKEIAQKREAFFANEYCRNMRLLLPNASDDGLFEIWYTYGSGDGFPCILFGQLACRAHLTCGCFFQLLFLFVEFQRLS
jgi:hypothetical protein